MARVTIEASETVNADPATTWNLVGDFGGLLDWFPGLQGCRQEGEGVGALRHLTMPDGAVLVERQTDRQEGVSYSYTIEQGEVPFSDYQSTIRLVADGSGTRIDWDCSFEPAPGAEEAAKEFVSGVYNAGLAQIKKVLGG